MPVFSYDDPDFFERVTPEVLRYHRKVARDAGSDINAVSLLADDPADEDAPLALLLDLPPGYTIDRHAHGCHRFEIIVRGSVETEGRTLLPGSIMRAGPGEYYGPMKAGPDGAVTCEIFSSRARMEPIPFGMPSERLATVISQLRNPNS